MSEPTFALPDHWSKPAREAVEEVLSARPDLAGGDVGALEQAAELVTLADALSAVAADAGYVSRGDAGQQTTHRAVTEARLARAQAAAILGRLTEFGTAMDRSSAGRALARKRWAR
ncbi:hypothetical protein Q6346_04875 [Isoptericola sp. b490]|uniref:hypothetical protein n=1 Tax=Actinotalea lenta TaxID=3064654 RepID=UPI002713FD44|nr:hypothetical protein [Isoptericola sp. b490]MDO8120646.1 hypothetical protein [Isoptericola sp. b490]